MPASLLFNTPVHNLQKELRIQPQERVLDIGSGRGSLLQILASKVAFEQRPLGIEPSRTLLDLASNARSSAGLLQAAQTHLPLRDETFELAVASHATHRLEDDEVLMLLSEMRRVLKPGGLALLWDFAPTRSQALNAFHMRLLEMETDTATLRNYTTLSAFALQASFDWVSNAHLRPFLFPPIPRVSILLGKAPQGWHTNLQERGLTTHQRSLVNGPS